MAHEEDVADGHAQLLSWGGGRPISPTRRSTRFMATARHDHGVVLDYNCAANGPSNVDRAKCVVNLVFLKEWTTLTRNRPGIQQILGDLADPRVGQYDGGKLRSALASWMMTRYATSLC